MIKVLFNVLLTSRSKYIVKLYVILCILAGTRSMECEEIRTPGATITDASEYNFSDEPRSQAEDQAVNERPHTRFEVTQPNITNYGKKVPEHPSKAGMLAAKEREQRGQQGISFKPILPQTPGFHEAAALQEKQGTSTRRDAQH